MKSISSQPRKVRKRMIHGAPLNVKARQLVAPLSEELQKEHNVKRLRVRKGDTILVLRGSFRGHEGKVIKVDVKKVRIYVEGVTKVRSDGKEVFVPIHPSKVIITKLDLSDSKRAQVLERKRMKAKVSS